MIFSFIMSVFSTSLVLISRYGYLFETEIQLSGNLLQMNTLSKTYFSRYTLEDHVPYKHPLKKIGDKVHDDVLYLNLFLEMNHIQYNFKKDGEIFVKFDFLFTSSEKCAEKNIDNEIVEFICQMEYDEDDDDIILNIDKSEVFKHFLKKEYSNLIDIFSFKKSLENFKSEDKIIKQLVEELKNAITKYNEEWFPEERSACLNGLAENFINKTKVSNVTIDSQFEFFMNFKKELFEFIDFDLDKSLRLDLFDGENFMKIRKCLKINIFERDNLNKFNTKVEVYNRKFHKIANLNYLVYDNDIILFEDELIENEVRYMVVHHTVNGRTEKSDLCSLKPIHI